MTTTLPAELEPLETVDPSSMISGVGSSIDFTSEARDLSQITFTTGDQDDDDDEDLYSESIVLDDPTVLLASDIVSLQSTLKQSQGNLQTCEDIILKIATFDADLHQKCTTKAVLDLLPKNSRLAEDGNFKTIQAGVDILVKYAVNLLKPKKNPNWRSIKTSNKAFLKVELLQGHDAVLEALGYSVRTPASFEFLSTVAEPAAENVATVTADLLILQKELSLFCSHTHINRDRFIGHFSSVPRSEPPSSLFTPEADIHLQRVVQPLSPHGGPTDPTGETNHPGADTEPTTGANQPVTTEPEMRPKPPVPAPRRSLTPSFKKDAVSEQPLQPDLPPKAASDIFPSVANLPDVKSPTGDKQRFTESGDIVPSVGVIKYPPSLHASPTLQVTSPKAVPRSAGASPSSESALKKPTDFTVPASTVKPVIQQSRPGVNAPQGHGIPPIQATQPHNQRSVQPGYSHGGQSSQHMATDPVPQGPRNVPPRVYNLPATIHPVQHGGASNQHPVTSLAGPHANTQPPINHSAASQGLPTAKVDITSIPLPDSPVDVAFMDPAVPGSGIPSTGPPIDFPAPTKLLQAGFSDPTRNHVPTGAGVVHTPQQTHAGATRYPQQRMFDQSPASDPTRNPAQTGAGVVHTPQQTHAGTTRYPQQGMSDQPPGRMKPFKPPPGAVATPFVGRDPGVISREGLQSPVKPTAATMPAPTGVVVQVKLVPLDGVTLEKCAMCDGKDGIIQCDKCQSARCEPCDKRWHSHPKRKTHTTRMLVRRVNQERPALVKKPTPKEEPVEDIGDCYICGENKADVEYKCLTCDDYFHEDCFRRFHNRPNRMKHEKKAVGRGRRPIAAGDNRGQVSDIVTHPASGAIPKQAYGQVANQSSPSQRPPTQKQPPPLKPAMSKRQQLAARIDDLVAKDVGILEKLADVTRRYGESRAVEIEGQLMKEEKLLRIRHQELEDEMDRLKDELDWLDLQEKKPQQLGRPDQMQTGHQADNRGYDQRSAGSGNQQPAGTNQQPGGYSQYPAGTNQYPTGTNQGSAGAGQQSSGYHQPPPATSQYPASTNQYPGHPQPVHLQHSNQPTSGGRPVIPPKHIVVVQKWMCEHCTYLNEDINSNICSVCDKTTADPRVTSENQEQPHEVPMEVETSLQATSRPPVDAYPQAMDRPAVEAYPQAPGRPPVKGQPQEAQIQYETSEERKLRQDREEREKLAAIEAEEHQKQQYNMSHRLIIMFTEAREFGYSLEDVKTAWDLLDREKSQLSPAEWLKKHLESQLKMIKNDAIKEFCRQFKMDVPENSEQYLSTPEVHEAWHRNDGCREKTAADCVRRIVDKVDEFLESTAGITERADVAKLLLDNSFDVELSRWELQRKAAEATAGQVDDWLAQMWETTHATDQVIGEIFKSNLSENDKKEKVRRMLMAERGMLWAAVDSVFIIHNDGHTWSDSIEAVEACDMNVYRAKDYFKECEVCFQRLIMSKLIGIPYCGCHICTECFTGHFSQLAQNIACMLSYTCPGCDEPNLPGMDGNAFQDYFGLLGSMLKRYLEPGDCNLFHSKLVTWGLMTEENFRWCAHGCGNGFLLDGLRIKKVQCPHCQSYQCFDCGKPWADQHEGVTCEEFEAWKRANDPELQAQGLAAHLELNGINCPKCKMRYELAKGGCMHFKCPQCRHEFCCGCNLPFMNHPACNKFPSCKDKGLHAHHPRDCLYHLRDQPVGNLQKLLQDNAVDYDGPAAAKNDTGTCQVNVQLETNTGLQDNVCGKALVGQSGLCELHYKEYLVTLINKKRLDPVSIFDAGELMATLGRNNKPPPPKQVNEGDDAYRKRLMEVLMAQIPLARANPAEAAGGQAAAQNNRL